jgi:hypothetical protein
LIIFEGEPSLCLSPEFKRLSTGGLTIRLDLIRQNILLSALAALIGVLTPIALSFALLYAGFGHG